MEAVRLKQIDQNFWTHLQAWLTFAAKAEKKAGKGKTKPVYSKFKKFFDYDKELAQANGVNEAKFSGVGKILRK
jgi:hypothetical protein